MRISVFVSLALLISKSFLGQIEFAPDGKLMFLQAKDNKLECPATFTSTAFTEANTKAVKELKDFFLKKLTSTINNLNEPDNESRKFLLSISDLEFKKLITNLTNLKARINGANPSAVLDQGFDQLWLKINEGITASQVFTCNLSADNTELTLTKTAPLNSILIKFYNESYTANEISKIKPTDLNRYSIFLSKWKTRSDFLIANSRKILPPLELQLGQLNKQIEALKKEGQKERAKIAELEKKKEELAKKWEAQVGQLELFCDSLAKEPDYEGLKELSKNNWFKQWIWMREGSMKLNPLDFTTPAFLSKYPEYDINKSQIFEAYIDSLLKCSLKGCKDNLDDFKKILALKGTSRDIYSLKEKNDKLNKENDDKLKAMAYTSRYLNVVKIPAKVKYYSYSITDKFTSKDNNDSYLDEAISTEENKTVVIHNIPSGPKVQLVEKNKAIADRSELQSFLDTSVSQLGELAVLIGKLSPYAPLFNPIYTKDNGAVGVLGLDGGVDPRKQIVEDNLILAQLTEIFSNSTFPVDEVKADVNKTPVYHSEILTTKKSDSPIKKTVFVISVTKGDVKADTSKIADFSYKVGKFYRFQLSAGIAYTMNKNFSQTIVKEENNKITITNTAQLYHFTAGAHVYFGKGLFLQNNSLSPKGRGCRGAFYFGVAIPKPLENIYTGISWDLVPGFKVIGGVHIYRNDKYTILNNHIIEQRIRYGAAGPFISLAIDPTSLAKALDLIKTK